MAPSGRFLFVTWAGGGNVNPVLALGARLRGRGHQVRVLGPRRGLRERFEAEGIAYHAHRSGEEWTQGEALRRPPPGSEEQRRAFLRGLCEDVLSEIAREPTDAVIVDYMQPAALCAAEQSGLPVAALVHTLYQRVAIGEHSPMEMAADPAAINALRAELGLPAVGRLSELLDRVARVLVVTARELDRPVDPLARNVRFVGPIIEDAGRDAAWTRPWPVSDGPLVLCSMSTTPMDDAGLIQRLLDALDGAPLRMLVTLGPHLAASAFRVPDNAALVPYLRHAAVLPHARMMITHAGLSSIGAALSFGVPMLCLPLGREQPDNAEHVQATGAGLALPKDAEPAALRAAVLELLDDPRYLAAAQRLAAALEAGGYGWHAVDELEALIRIWLTARRTTGSV
jgi:MGT family glycosyltransferase